jgi:hypothetical protein
VVGGVNNVFAGNFSSNLTFTGGSAARSGDGTSGNELIMRPDGSFLVLGPAIKNCPPGVSGPCAIGLVWLLPNGQVDTSRGSSGNTHVTLPAAVDVQGGDILDDGRIVVGGSLGGKATLFRLLADGSTLDPTFGPGGAGYYSGETGAFPSVAVGPDGNSIVVFDSGSESDPFRVQMFSPLGFPQTPFGSGGALDLCQDGSAFGTCPPRRALAGTTGRARVVKVQADGKALVAGSLGGQLTVARLRSGLLQRVSVPVAIRAGSATR